jgi:NAD(P)-dependent dehydrogenase (short-subunit alcohol dehydrogenase family)
MHDKVVVITGGNSGIGLETAAALAGAGARVVMGCRNSTKAEGAVAQIRMRTGNDAVESRPLDLIDLDGVRRFASSLSDLDRIDVLINNAGLILDSREESPQGHEATFAINHLGPFELTNLLLPQISAAPAGRVVNVGSVAHVMAPTGIDWADLDRRRRYRGWLVYGQSKLANILHANELARRLDGTGVVAHSLHPGSISSGFGREGDLHGFNDRLVALGKYVLISPEEGARTSVYVASSADAGRSSGDYWVRGARGRTAPWGRNEAEARYLWRISEQLVAE